MIENTNSHSYANNYSQPPRPVPRPTSSLQRSISKATSSRVQAISSYSAASSYAPRKKQQYVMRPEFATPQVINWGTAHPNYGADSKHTTWSMDEVNYIKDNFDNLPSNQFCAHLKKLIFSDRAAWPIFHENHLDVKKLRNGVEAFERIYQVATDDE